MYQPPPPPPPPSFGGGFNPNPQNSPPPQLRATQPTTPIEQQPGYQSNQPQPFTGVNYGVGQLHGGSPLPPPPPFQQATQGQLPSAPIPPPGFPHQHQPPEQQQRYEQQRTVTQQPPFPPAVPPPATTGPHEPPTYPPPGQPQQAQYYNQAQYNQPPQAQYNQAPQQPPGPPPGQQQYYDYASQPQQQGGTQHNTPPKNTMTNQQNAGNTPTNSSFGSASPTTPSGGGGTTAKRARQKASSRIDSSQVPSPCRDLPVEQANQPRLRYVTSKGLPPPSTTNCIAVDDGNASPKFIRPTLHTSPYDDGFLRDSGMSWGAVLSPIYDNNLTEEEHPPVISGRLPVRCKRCRAYMSSIVKFTDLGKTWHCVFCDISNEVEAEYFCNLDPSGRRRDMNDKPELSRGSVEYDVDGIDEYTLKTETGATIPTKPQHHLFAFDISKTARSSLPDVVDSARVTLRQMAEKYPMCKVSFITYASTIQFYNFKHPSMPQLIVPDVDNPFVPLPFTLLCWMTVFEELDKIETFLDRMPQISELADEEKCAVGAVVKVCSLILSETGGKVILTASKAADCGVGIISPRPEHKLYGTDQEKELLKPSDGFWPSIAIESAKQQISFDLMMFSTQYCELITMGQICHVTSGIQSLFLNYAPEDKLRLLNAFEKSLLQTAGYGAILRVRCSPGVRVKQYHGHYLSQDPHDMDLAGVHGSSTFFVELAHEAKIDPKTYCCMQAAMLYTTRCGHRRIRVHTLRMTVCNTYSALFRNADLESSVISLIHRSLHDAVNKGPKQAREISNKQLIDMLVAYRKYCSSGSHSGQLLLPEQLKLFPLYNLAVKKSDALAEGTAVRIDERVQCIYDLLAMPLQRVLHFLYPKMYAIHNILNTQTLGTFNPTSGLCHLPSLQQLTADVIMTHGIYALHDSQANTVYLWVGSQVSTKAATLLFGVEDPADIGVATPFEEWHERMQNILMSMIRNETGMDRLVILHEKRDVAEESFWRCMVEDEEKPGAQSYSDLLCALHKNINTRLA